MATYTIGALAKEVGLSTEALRYYERLGLLQPAERTPTGYRRYDEHALHRLRFIRQAQALGFTLEEIRELLELHWQKPSPAVCRRVQEQIEQKLRLIRRKRTLLERLEFVLEELLQACRERRPTEPCPVLKALHEDTAVQPFEEEVL
jgi:MerR family mercuric resistance operon transcriptional regulator/MerR family gold-responsive transcriptional activator of gol and ges genes